MDRFDLDGTTRVSMAPYNDNSDIDACWPASRTPQRPCDERPDFQERIVALAKAKTGAGKLAEPTKTARRDNPLCGDRVIVDVKLDGEGRIAAIGHQVRGCLLCQASASALSAVAVGRDAAGIAELRHDAERALGPRAGRGARTVLCLCARRRPQVAPGLRASAARSPQGRFGLIPGAARSLEGLRPPP